MAQFDQQNTAQLDLTGQETDVLSQPSQDPSREDVGNRSSGGSEGGKEAECPPGELLPTPPQAANLNASDQVDRPELLTVPSHSSSSSLASAVAHTPARPNLVQSQSHSASAVAHPKKFSSVNINKKFLEKTNSASTTATTMTTTSASAKASGSTISRPPAQSSSPHPRLVTTKLTATASSPSSAPGWSRPSSTGPSAAATGANSPNTQTPAPPVPSNPPPSSSVPVPAAPPLPHAGKVIQPVPRTVTQQHTAVPTGPVKETGSNNSSPLSSKPVWGNLRQSSTTSGRSDMKANDFPTAAEVALGMRKCKPGDQPAKDEALALSSTSASKRNEEADTFRGVHLDPNAHHWDEMVEDDETYWDNVIEFGDGRQYKVEAVEQINSKSREPSPPTSVKSSRSARLESVDVPVTKEERFAEDFDRSWPSGSKHPPPVGVQQRSPQEPPRVLFNERSNKLEPYSNHRPVLHGPFPGKRGSFQERNMSPTESRSGSSFYPHGAPRTAGVPTADFGSNRSRRFSNASNSSFVAPNERDRRDRRDAVPASPRIPKDNVGLMGRPASLRGRDRDGERDVGTLERGRQSTMGPPPIPPHAWRNSSKDSTKQHLSTPLSANGPTPPFSAGGRRLPSDDTSFHQNEQPDFPGSSPIIRAHPHSPALSHASTKAAWISPATSSLPLPALDGHDLEEIKKDVMHSAAERAKQRRQQEEEEREAQKERARKKAAEVEARMKAKAEEKAQKEEAANPVAREQEEQGEKEQDSSSAKKEAEVLAIINEAVGGEESSDVAQLQRTTSKPAHRRGPVLDVIQPRRFNSTGGSVTSPSVAETADTWRRAVPLPRESDEPRLIQRRSSNSVAFLPPPPPAPLDHVQTLADGKKEDLEVVDFTDMGKFVGESSEQMETPRKAPRPVAADFFSDPPSPVLPQQSLSPSIRNDIETWRRQTPLRPSGGQSPSTDRREAPPAADSPIVAEQVHKTNEGITDARQPSVSPSSSHQRPRPQNYYQAPMSSLVDAMSRIKGAIHDMKAEEMGRDNVDTPLASQAQPTQPSVSLPSKFKERWVPHYQRVKRVENQEESPEEPYTTAVEPPQSPPPSSGLSVNLPSASTQREAVNRRRLQQFFRPPFPVHLDILSFDPPVEGMTKRNLSLNDVLFRPTVGFKGKTKCFVHLPGSRNIGIRNHTAMQTGVKTNSFGAFGKQADTATSWRKSTSEPPQANSAVEVIESTSRSPPPEPTSLPRNDKQGESSTAENSVPPPRRSQPKMPEGSCVAFSRNSRVDLPNTEPKIVVNFIVSSEIDDSHGSQSQEVTKTKEETATDPSGSSKPIKEIKEGTAEVQMNSDVPVLKLTTDSSKVKITASPAESDLSSLPSVSEKNSDKPSHQSSPWPTTKNLPLKESPARAPDPEHLKAVWSQTSNDKAGLQPVNSLEGIADDLTSLPFTLQDVKSEDGETPPPPPSGPSMRMSLHDVTRAFQQVPSSSTANHKPSISPPSTTAPVARPAVPNFSYPLPPRPAYATYPSPMMSHSPSPTMMYPHVVSSPVPARMQPNGHATMYNPPPPMWVPVQPSAQNSNGMMRPMASPYAATMMPYPPNGAPMYSPAMPTNVPGTPQSQNLQANRNRNVPVMSPVMQHAGAPGMYPASPAMMHIQMTPTTGYMPLPTGRGQPRPENGQMGMQQSNSAHPPTSHVGFSPVPHSPFMRNW